MTWVGPQDETERPKPQRPHGVTRRVYLPSGLLPKSGTGLLIPPQHVQPLARVRFYIDSVEAFLASTRETDRERLHDTFRGASWSYNAIKHDGRTTGFNVKLQLPQRLVLRELDDMLLEWRGFNGDTPGSITRLDFSADFEPLDGHTAEDIERWILAHMIVPNRRPGEVFHYEASRYFTKSAHQNENSRDIVLYADKTSKYLLRVDGDERPVTHLDIRMRGKRTIEAEGIRTLADAIEKPPLEVLFSHLFFTSTDIEPLAREWIQDRYTPTPTDEKTVARFASREQLNLAQRVKERLGIPMPMDPCPPFVISQRLNWLPTSYGRGAP